MKNVYTKRATSARVELITGQTAITSHHMEKWKKKNKYDRDVLRARNIIIFKGKGKAGRQAKKRRKFHL